MIVMMWAKLRIRSRLSALLAAISFAVPATYVFAAEARSEQVALQSATYADFRQLLSREAPTAANTVPAVLSFPEQARDRFPAVVVVHTVGGYRDDNEGQYAAELRRAGFATLTFDSFAARNTTGIAMARAGVGLWPTGVADAYAALRLLAADSRIDAGRIAIAGFPTVAR